MLLNVVFINTALFSKYRHTKPSFKSLNNQLCHLTKEKKLDLHNCLQMTVSLVKQQTTTKL